MMTCPRCLCRMDDAMQNGVIGFKCHICGAFVPE